ncbi:hypothetical protein BGY98DRAFT_942396 [Russula aff. rugulosa BPL654]|nr:hypothetical protein BGY98DRAFT_942396 [Russula aff. rugulosa BPL654]
MSAEARQFVRFDVVRMVLAMALVWHHRDSCNARDCCSPIIICRLPTEPFVVTVSESHWRWHCCGLRVGSLENLIVDLASKL